MEQKTKIGISIGDLNGIGGEIILKTLEDIKGLDFITPIIFASINTMNYYKKHFNNSIEFNVINDINKALAKRINVLNIWNETVKIKFGVENPETAKYAILSFKAATKALKSNQIDVLVTAPINKHSIQSKEFKFPGHTDYLSQELKGESLMFMISKKLKIGLLTDHVPLNEVSSAINEDLIINKTTIIQKSLIEDFGIVRPKIAILGINPHTGDHGVIGNEDDKIIRPTISKLQAKGNLIYGPYSADSFFGSKTYKTFDAILASYHDQGLIPFKTLTFGQGVNFTAGLNKVRTSPDHGTAFEIAGQGKANHTSFKEALFTGLKIFKNRAAYKAINENHNSKNY